LPIGVQPFLPKIVIPPLMSLKSQPGNLKVQAVIDAL
jgi:hypothetical protein